MAGGIVGLLKRWVGIHTGKPVIWLLVFMLILAELVKVEAYTTDVPASRQECGKWINLTKQRGLVSNDNYPQLYPAHSCQQWYINYEQPNYIITISFEDINIPGPDDCSVSYVELGPTPQMTLCGNINLTSPQVYISQRNHVWLRFVSSSWDSGRGFSFRYLSAENVTSIGCLEDEFRCDYGKCILDRWRCNGAYECEDGSDERSCKTTKVLTTPAPLACRDSNFGCIDVETNAYHCFLHYKQCDDQIDCKDGSDERNCAGKNNFYLEGPSGYFHSPRFPANYAPNAHYSWTIHVDKDSIIQLRFIEFSLPSAPNTDYLNIYDGPNSSHRLIGSFYGGNKPAHIMESTSNRLYLQFVSDDTGSDMGFNVSYQIKGVCMASQQSCGHGENECYEADQHCDDVWDCPRHGGDERGCGKCGPEQFRCGKDSAICYPESERCNGQPHCTSHKNDEANCTPEQCGTHNGTFLCNNRLCIYESWVCDGQNDCQDSSDEINCSRPSVKVITAAVIGSLICGLLLVVALGCTCKLYALRMQEHAYVPITPSLHEHAAMWARMFAPPPYPEAMATSRNYEEVRQEILRQEMIRRERRRRGRGRSARRHRRDHGNASQQTDDVALLDLAAGQDGDVACISLALQLPEDEPCQDSESEDSECEPEPSAVQIDLATGVQWHRQVPKFDDPPLLVPPAPPSGNAALEGNAGTENSIGSTSSIPPSGSVGIIGSIGVPPGGNQGNHRSFDSAQSGGSTSLPLATEQSGIPRYPSFPPGASTSSPPVVSPVRSDVHFAVPVNSNNDCRHCEPNTCDVGEATERSESNLDLMSGHCEHSSDRASNSDSDTGTCPSRDTRVAIPEPSIDDSSVTTSCDTINPSDLGI